MIAPAMGNHNCGDFLALMGDDVDGLPGVDGVGEKLAARLLNLHGDLDGVIALADDIKGKLGERIRDSFAAARLSRQLATMRTDVPLGITPRDIQCSPSCPPRRSVRRKRRPPPWTTLHRLQPARSPLINRGKLFRQAEPLLS